MHRIVRAVVVSVAVVAMAGCAGSTEASPPPSTSAGSAPATTGGTPPAPTRTAGPSAGCEKDAAVTAGESEIHLDADGADRWYLLHVPTGYRASSPMPLVVDIHGYAEGAKLQSVVSGLGPFGDTQGFVTVTPNGQGTPVHWDANLGSPDVKLIGTILDRTEAELCIDTARVYVTGYSNGAFMTSAVACQYADRIAAAAPVAGMRDIPGCTFSRPVPVIAFHGTADHFVEYDGGMGSAAAALPAPDGSGRTLGEAGPTADDAVVPGSMDQKMPDIAAAWATRNGCQPTPTEAPAADDVTHISFSCPAGHEVELYRVNDGGHTWPGSQTSSMLGSVTGRTTMSISANELMWAFFTAHPLSTS